MVVSGYNAVVLVVSSTIFTVIYRHFSPQISTKWCRRFCKFGKRDKIEWNERIVSSFHAIIASVISTAILVSDQDMQNNPVWGYSTWAKTILGFTLSYMAVDMVIMFSCFRSSDLVYIFHHFAAIVSYFIAIEANFLLWFACVRLTAEWSTLFVNARWHMHMTGAKDTKIYMLNGLVMVLSFFLCRVVPMPYFWYQVYSYYDTIPKVGLCALLFSCIILDSLNLFWMYKLTVGLFKTLGTTQFVCRIRHILSRVVEDLNNLLVELRI